MKDRAAALRYARSLDALLDGDAEVTRTTEEMAAVARVMAGDATVAGMLVNPGVDLARKKALIDTLAAGAKLSSKTAGFLRLLAEHGRLHLLPEAAELLAGLRDKRMGIVEAVVTTASALTPEMAEQTRQTLEKKTGLKIRLALKTDPSLIGGMVAKVGSTVYDGSVLARLAALRGHIARS